MIRTILVALFAACASCHRNRPPDNPPQETENRPLSPQRHRERKGPAAKPPPSRHHKTFSLHNSSDAQKMRIKLLVFLCYVSCG